MNPEKGVQDVAAASGKSRPVYWPPISARSRILIAKDVLKRYHAGIGRDFGNNAEHQLQERKKMAHGGQMRFGLWDDFRRPEHSELSFPEIYQQTLEHIRYAEQLGIDDIWLSEHHFIEDGYLPSVLATAAAIAAITKNVAIGTNVLLLPFHHPVTVAEEAAVVDIISGGRFYGVRTGEEFGLQEVRLLDQRDFMEVSDKVAMANYRANKLVCDAADRAIQVHGGIGYTRAKPFEHIYRHHRRYRITEGSEEIQIRRIAAVLFGYMKSSSS